MVLGLSPVTLHRRCLTAGLGLWETGADLMGGTGMSVPCRDQGDAGEQRGHDFQQYLGETWPCWSHWYSLRHGQCHQPCSVLQPESCVSIPYAELRGIPAPTISQMLKLPLNSLQAQGDTSGRLDAAASLLLSWKPTPKRTRA